MLRPEFATITVDETAPVGRLTLNRPARRNAIDVAMLEELLAAAAWFDAVAGVRLVVVAGAGADFCAGFDLREQVGDRLGPGGGDWTERRRLAQLGGRMADAVEAMRPVTVAALHGNVVGGGLVLAAACDLRVAATGTTFSIPEVALGIPLAWGGIPRLVRDIGPARTKELVMTCRPFGAAEAHAMGLVNRVVPDDAVAAALQLAEDLAARPEVPLEATKQHVNAVARVASGADFSFADGDALLAAFAAPESRTAAAEYVAERWGGASGQGHPEEESGGE